MICEFCNRPASTGVTVQHVATEGDHYKPTFVIINVCSHTECYTKAIPLGWYKLRKEAQHNRGSDDLPPIMGGKG